MCQMSDEGREGSRRGQIVKKKKKVHSARSVSADVMTKENHTHTDGKLKENPE